MPDLNLNAGSACILPASSESNRRAGKMPAFPGSPPLRRRISNKWRNKSNAGVVHRRSISDVLTTFNRLRGPGGSTRTKTVKQKQKARYEEPHSTPHRGDGVVAVERARGREGTLRKELH